MIRAMSQSQTRRPQTCLAACADSTRSKSSDEGVFIGWPATVTVTARWNNSTHVEINGVKARLNRPLHFKKVGTGGAVEGVFVSRFQISAFLSLGKRQVGRVADSTHGIADTGQILRTDQQIDIAGLALCDVAIDYFCQRQALIGHDVDAELGQEIDDSN